MTNKENRKKATKILAGVDHPRRLAPIAERPDLLVNWLSDDSPAVRANTALIITELVNIDPEYVENHPEIEDALQDLTQNVPSDTASRIKTELALCELNRDYQYEYNNIVTHIQSGKSDSDHALNLLLCHVDQLCERTGGDADSDIVFSSGVIEDLLILTQSDTADIQQQIVQSLAELMNARAEEQTDQIIEKIHTHYDRTEIVAEFESILKCEDEKSRRAASYIVAELARKYPDDVNQTVDNLTDAIVTEVDRSTRRSAAAALSRIAKHSATDILPVVDTLRSQSENESHRSKVKTRLNTAINALESAQQSAQAEADEKATTASEYRSDGDDYFHESAFEEAERAYVNARESYTAAIDIAREYNLTALVEQFNQQRDAVTERLEYTKLARLSEAVDIEPDDIAANPQRSAKDLITIIKEIDEAADTISEPRRESIEELREQARSMLTEAYRLAIHDLIEKGKEQEVNGELLHAKDTYQEAKQRSRNPNATIEIHASEDFDEVTDCLVDKCTDHITKIDNKIMLQTIGEPAESESIPEPRQDPEDNNLPDHPEIAVADPDLQATYNSSSQLEFDDITKGRTIGGMQGGTVYEATIPTDEGPHQVALKEPQFEEPIGEPSDESLLNEIEKWEQVEDHPYVVDILDWETTPHAWIAMEYMDKEHLAIYSQQRSIAVDEALWIGECLADALAYAHEKDIVHTDIKPRNILLTSTVDAPWNVPKIADWGLARFVRNHSGSQQYFSAGYGAPEQFTSEEFGGVSFRTDEYQLGVVLYELLASRHPFPERPQSPSPNKLRQKPKRLTDYADVPTEVASVIEQMIEPYQEDRYGSMEQIRETLNELRTGDQIDQTIALTELADVYTDLVRQSRFSYTKTKQSIKRLRRFVDNTDFSAEHSDIQEELKEVDEEWLPMKNPDEMDTAIEEIDSELYHRIEEICDAVEQISAQTADKR